MVIEELYLLVRDGGPADEGSRVLEEIDLVLHSVNNFVVCSFFG